jgi:hypothetical protein
MFFEFCKGAYRLSETKATLLEVVKGCNFLLKIAEKRGSTRLYINASLISSVHKDLHQNFPIGIATARQGSFDRLPWSIEPDLTEEGMINMGILAMYMQDPSLPTFQLGKRLEQCLHLVTRFPLKTKKGVIEGIKDKGPGCIIDGNIPGATLPEVSHPAVLQEQTLAIMAMDLINQFAEHFLEPGN